MERGDVGSWLSGPPVPGPTGGYRGQRLGLPAAGPGSLAGLGPRLAALIVDWVACVLLTRLFFPHVRPPQSGVLTLLIFAVEVFILTALTGSSFGQRLFGMGVRAVGGGRLPVLAVLVRTVLLCLLIPAVVWDSDGRGLHDRVAGGVLVRTR